MTPPILSKEEPSGFVLLDKPKGMTSFQVLFPVKRRFSTKRVGHAGTLDQEASGLMIVGVGKCTRLLDEIEAQSKLYSFTLHLGRETDTLEWVGETVYSDENALRNASQLEEILPRFVGELEQIPPRYSAIKMDGQRASDLVRKGKEVEMKSRFIEIYSLQIIGDNRSELSSTFPLICHCSKGTYIRSLGRDLARAMGTFGCVSEIRRLAIGDIKIEQSQDPQQRDFLELIPAQRLLPWPTWNVDDVQLAHLRQGRSLAKPESFAHVSGVRIFAMFEGVARVVLRVSGHGMHPEVQIA